MRPVYEMVTVERTGGTYTAELRPAWRSGEPDVRQFLTSVTVNGATLDLSDGERAHYRDVRVEGSGATLRIRENARANGGSDRRRRTGAELLAK